MPTKEQLTERLESVQSENVVLRGRLDLATLQDHEAIAYDKVVKALNELQLSESRTSQRTFTDTGSGYGPVQHVNPVSRVLNAAAARFGLAIEARVLAEVVERLFAAERTQTELRELKDQRSAVEAIMYLRETQTLR